MAWYDEAIFYHIYPLGLTGAPKENSYEQQESRLNAVIPWISHIKEIGCNAIYIGPLFESVGHGYETTDYRKLDSRLGTNEDLTNFVAECHRQGIRVILDGVFNHTGRDFFAFQDLKRNRENSPYKDWFCNVNFWGNNEYNDGFSYENWGGYNLLVKLNQKNPAVRDYICDVIRFWVKEFDIDGIRLDAADVLDFDYMKALRHVANEVKPDFWLMGEVIHGDYSRWVNEGTLHSVTNYQLHKALYSGHNDHNYFEIAHTVRRLYEMGGNGAQGLKLYNFVDNHDVERIHTKLNNKAHFAPVHVLLYTLPGIPSIYYGSEFGIEGRKEYGSDASLRPALNLADFADATEKNPCTRLIAALGKARQKVKAFSYGDYKELLLTTTQYAFSRNYDGVSALVTVNNDDGDFSMTLPAGNCSEYRGVLSGEVAAVCNGQISVTVKGNSGEVWLPADLIAEGTETIAKEAAEEEANVVETCVEEPEMNADVPEEKEMETAAEESNVTEESAADKVEEKEEDLVLVEKEKTETEKKQSVMDEEAKGESREDSVADEPEAVAEEEPKAEVKEVQEEEAPKAPKSYEEMSIEELQEAILERMRRNGPITDQMRKDVRENVYHNSLLNWIRSFH